MPITKSTRLTAVDWRTRRALLAHGSLCSTQRSTTSSGYTSLNMVRLTCSQTLSSIAISRHLYIESSCVFDFLAFCQKGAFLSTFSPFWLKGDGLSTRPPPCPTSAPCPYSTEADVYHHSPIRLAPFIRAFCLLRSQLVP